MRHKTPPTLLTLAVSAFLLLAYPVAASAQQENEQDEPGELAREGVERMMRALELFIDMIPQYEMPELDENGDIIIRRKRDSESDPAPDDEIDQTRT